jgi:hypothetical protein
MPTVSSKELDADFPHTYKQQRTLEAAARKTRQRASEQPNVKLPPMCGYTYTKRKPRNPTNWTPGTETCVRVAGSGTDHPGHGYCDYHEVQASKDMSKSRLTNDIVAAKKIAYHHASFFGEGKPTDPHQALMEEISRTTSIIAWIESHMVEMREGGMTEDAILTQFTKQNGFVAGVWMELYRQEREHLVRTCTAAIKAGVAERRIQIAEQQGQLIVGMMMAFLHDPEIGLSPEQISLGPQIIRKHMLSLPMSNPAEDDSMKVINSVAHEVQR